MNKVFKRLLSVMLALVMVVGMIPLSAVPAKAAVTVPKGTTIYFDPSPTWETANAAFGFVSSANMTNSDLVVMQQIGTTGIYKGTLLADATNISFRRLNPANTTEVWSAQSAWPEFSSGNYLYTLNDGAYELATGSWSSYTESGDDSTGDDDSTSRIIYLDASATNFDTAGATFAVKLSGGSSGDQLIAMTKVYPANSNDHYYKAVIPSGYTHIAFLRCNPSGDTGWGNLVDYKAWPTIPSDGSNCYVASGYDTNGTWTTYSGDSTATDTNSIFYVQTDLVDYLNDWRVRRTEDQHQYRDYNQGDQVSMIVNGGVVDGDSSPYSYLNQVISGQGYATPMYFGPLYLIQMRYGRTNGDTAWRSLSNWNTGANVAPTTNTGANNYDASVQGLVGSTLKNGNLTDTSGKELLYFSKTAAETYESNGKKVMEYYSGLEFPFNAEYDSSTGVTTYSYDSASDKAVYYNYSNKRLYTSDTHIKNNTDDKNGYYPLNEPGDSGSAINMGFGTKFTIPFTISDDGKINGEAVTFNFTGDDDVWVFIDGQLVLDMGGAHTMSSGTIDFANLQATVENAYKVDTSRNRTSGNTWELSCYSGKAGSYLFENNTIERDPANYANSGTTAVTTAFPETLKKDFQSEYDNNKGDVHTLTMFYMERGMFDSNMSISFTISPIPSGLVVSADLDTSNINKGLVSYVENVDEFSYSVVAKDLKNGFSAVAWDSYVLTDHNNTSTKKETDDSTITGVRADRYASTFSKDTNNAFVAGTSFEITEKIANTVFQYDESATYWKLYDADDSYKKIGETKADDDTTKLKSTFSMGDSGSDPTTVSFNYSLNYVNKIKTGDLKLTKTFSESVAGTEYYFTLCLDLDGAGTRFGSQPYAGVTYTSDKDSGGVTNASGEFSVQAGETVTFTGIPLGATYSIEEKAPEVAGTWTIDTITGADQDTENKYLATGTIDASEKAVTFTNKTDSVDIPKVIYVEAGKEGGTDYTLKDSDNAQIRISEITGITDENGTAVTDGTVTVTPDTDGDDRGKVNITTSNSNKKYDVAYKGSKDDGANVTGTITVYTFSATDKVYVFDYGLDSELTDITYGNGLFEDGVFFNTAAETTKNNEAASKYSTTASLMGDITPVTTSGNKTEITKDSTVTIDDSTGKTTGTVTCSIVGFMDGVESYTYQVGIKRNVDAVTTLNTSDPETGTVVNGTIKVMPANVVYYEDNFAGLSYTNNGGVVVKSEASKSLQSNDNDDTYGYDAVYNDTTATANNYSDGSVTSLERVAATTDEDGNTVTSGIPTFSFTFTGTGFDIVGRTNDDTAMITVVVKDASNNIVKYGAVDTYYSNGDLYQIPVLSIKDLTNAKYTVTVAVVNSTNGGSTFYLDGIRIYNPMSDASEYPTDAEKNVAFANIHQMLIGDGVISEDRYDGSTIIGVTNEGSEAVLVSYDSTNNKAVLYGDTNTESMSSDFSGYSGSMVDYLNKGPNNEVYLDPNAGIAFDVKGDVKTIQIEAKKIDITSDGDNNPTTDAEKSISIVGADGKLTSLEKVASKTAMYYNIPLDSCIKLTETTDGVEKVIGYRVILIAHDTISLSNIKYTAGCTFEVPSVSTYLTMPVVTPGEDAYTAKVEKVVFSPSASALKSGKRVTITVTLDTQEEFDTFAVYMVPDVNDIVEYINDEENKPITITRDSKKTTLTYTFTAPQSKGKYNFVIIPVNEDGERSCYQKSVAVTVK